MMFTDDILKVYRKQALQQMGRDSDNLDFFINSGRLDLKGIYKQVVAQQQNFKAFELISPASFYKSTVEGELLARIRQIFKSIGHLEHQQAILKDVSYILKKESNFIDTNSFIDKLYDLVINGKRGKRKSYYKYYVIIVRKLILWKQEIHKILALKVAYKVLISFLSDKIQILTKKIIQIPLKFDMREYLDLVLTFKDDQFLVNSSSQQLIDHLQRIYTNESRLYQVIMPVERIQRQWFNPRKICKGV